MIYDPARANPLNGNPLLSRDDLAKAVMDLFNPLLPYFSEGGARVRLSATGAHFDRAAADLEGFARPLWGIVPLAAGGYDFPHWALYRRGLANGTDPNHPEYWGDVSRTDQRQVELAAIGFAIAMVPQFIWDPLSDAQKKTIAAYLISARDKEFVDNNWKFFRVLIDLGLTQAGVDFDRSLTEKYLDEVEAFRLGEGWYRDGPVQRVDHYVPFALHFYALIYSVIAKSDTKRADAYRARAHVFAKDIRHWFGSDGASLAFGRSQTYRFACGGIWGALAFAGVEALPWSEIKGYYMRHIRWWSELPIAEQDGVLSIGYGYPNLMMSESYNSAGSPYWALKFFLPLALPADHPFWTADETPAPSFADPVPLKEAGMVAMHTPGNTVVLSSGQSHDKMLGANEKYSKFVYSTRYAFNIELNDRHFVAASFDGMLGLSDDGVHFRMREVLDEALIAGDKLYSRWKPWGDVTVESWLLPAAPWHIRIHRIQTPRALQTSEGGFAIPRADFNVDTSVQEPGRAIWNGQTDISAAIDLSPDLRRNGHAISAIANSNLIHAKTLVPQLRGEIAAGTTVLAAAFIALPNIEEQPDLLQTPPACPKLAELEAIFRDSGVSVTAFDL